MKYFLHLAYKGTHYRGWQKQTTARSVQEVVEASIAKMLGYAIPCIGCGRTDAGVHAAQYFCHITLRESISYNPVFRLNKMLPNDIVIYDFLPVHETAQAQFDVLDRTYTYFLHRQPSPFINDLSTYYESNKWEFETMKFLVKTLEGTHDFRAFCKQPDVHDSTTCKVTKATITQQQDRLVFTITANRFLKNMVRLLIGNVLEVGIGTLSKKQFQLALLQQQSLPYFKKAYSQGLYLSKVRYSYLDTPVRPYYFWG